MALWGATRVSCTPTFQKYISSVVDIVIFKINTVGTWRFKYSFQTHYFLVFHRCARTYLPKSQKVFTVFRHHGVRTLEALQVGVRHTFDDLWRVRIIISCATTWGFWGSRPLPFFLKMAKVPLHWNALDLEMAMRLFIILLLCSVETFIIIRLESSEIRKILAIFLPFLNLKNMIPGYTPLK